MRQRAGLRVVLLFFAAAAGCAETELKGPTHLLLISLDTVRADYCSAYGHSRATTPNLDALTRDGVLFENAYAPSSTTGPSHASLFTSLYPPAHGVVKNGLRLDDGFETLAERLREAGFQTAGFVASYALDASFGWDQGFEIWDARFSPDSTKLRMRKWEGHEIEGGFDRPGEAVTRAALDWLDSRDSSRPFFLFAHYFDAHEPYVAPDPVRSRFEVSPDASQIERERADYEASIAVADAALGELLRGLEARGLADTTLVIVFGDHGQGLHEHGVQYHGASIHEEQVRIPLVVSFPPGIEGSRRIQAPVELSDLRPTVMNLLDVRDESGGLDLSPALRSRSNPPEDRPVFFYRRPYAGGPADRRLAQRGVLKGNWKYIERVDESAPQLFNLAHDPDEIHDLSGTEAARTRALSTLVREVLPTSSDVAPTAPNDLERARLRALGYVD